MDKNLVQAYNSLTLIDIVALLVFISCWAGYYYFAETGSRGRRGLVGITQEYRLQWAVLTPTREIPVACASLASNLMSSVSFYASTTIYIIAGLFALIGTVDKLQVFTSDLPFAPTGSRALLELKLMLLIVVFVVAYFKFTWALRQFNFLTILIGGTPSEKYMPSEAYWRNSAKRMARINAQAGNEFNRGIRAYYYGIAALAWFVNPWLFLAATLWITRVLYNRDFNSSSVRLLRDDYPPNLYDPSYELGRRTAQAEQDTAPKTNTTKPDENQAKP
ncbi:DUF599 domain-containing protein [Agaribacterium haliotis]|uniref:DUF599 domain-containing protein n=1 Tax=Agaribacterium haliotis TaxID=2013869 RepID=UPI000BB57C6E|nr:DUF599 domain-containing protein [Agaribacterium haliotis]